MDKAKFQIAFAVLTWFAVCGPKPCEAASLTVSGGNWAMGTKEGGTTTTSTSSPNTWVVTNDFTGYEDITISAVVTGPGGSSWAPCDQYGQPAASCYVLTNTGPSGGELSATPYTLATRLAPSGTSSFGLSFKCPLTAEAGVQHTLTVTLTASRYCTGTMVGDVCWVEGTPGTSCNTACAGHGGCVSGDLTATLTHAYCDNQCPASTHVETTLGYAKPTTWGDPRDGIWRCSYGVGGCASYYGHDVCGQGSCVGNQFHCPCLY